MARLSEYTKDFHVPADFDLIARVDLHCTMGGSDKVYIITAVKDKKARQNDPYHLHVYYGRRGHNLTLMTYGGWQYEKSVIEQLQKRTEAKEKKGYRLRNRELFDANGTLIKSTGLPATSILGGTITAKTNAKTTSNPAPGSVKFDRDVDAVFKRLSSYSRSAFDLDIVSFHDFLKYLKTESIVHKLPIKISSDTAYVYATILGGVWYLFDANNLSPTTRPNTYYPHHSFPFDTISNVKENPVIWFGVYDKTKQELHVLDIVYASGVPNLMTMNWKSRRQIMNIAYDEMYPGVDPYNTKHNIRFVDYVYDDRETYCRNESGTFVSRLLNQGFRAKTRLTVI